MPADVRKELEAIREESKASTHEISQVFALQRIAASLEGIRQELVSLSLMLGRMSRNP